MRKVNYYLGLLLLLLVSCGDTIQPQGKGYLQLSKSAEMMTKADVVTDNFIVTVCREDGDMVYSAIRTYYPDLYELETGTYYVESEFPSKSNYKLAAFEQPRFYGCSSVLSIATDKVTVCEDIFCSLQNMKVTVTFAEEIKEQFEIYEAEVWIVDENGLMHSLTFDESSTTDGWFEPKELNVRFTGERKGFDEEVTKDFSITTNIKKGAHHKININGRWS